MKRLLVVLEQGDRLPSGVARGLAYRELFATNGFSATFVTRQPVDWFEKGRLGSLNVFPRLKNLVLRWATGANERRILALARDSDIVYLSKVYSYPLIRALREETNARIVYDLVDAVWVAEWDKDQFSQMLGVVDAVTTDNEMTASYARQFNSNCIVIPDAPALEEFDKRRSDLSNKHDERIILGWVGSPGTAYNLYVVWEALEELFVRHPELHLRLIGTGSDLRLVPEFEKVSFSYLPRYDQAAMVEEIFGMDIGLFPLQNVERCQMRGVFKATNYMCGEAVVVASPVGQCEDFIKEGVNGMLAATTQEWIDKLEVLIIDADLRGRLAQCGLATVRSHFRLDQSFAKLKAVLLRTNGDAAGN